MEIGCENENYPKYPFEDFSKQPLLVVAAAVSQDNATLIENKCMWTLIS